MKKQSIRQKLDAFAKQEIPDNVNLWPTILAQTEAMAPSRRHHHVFPQRRLGGLRLRSTSRYLKFALATVMVVLTSGLVVTTPVARAAVEAIIRRFGLALVDTTQMRNTTSSEMSVTTVAAPPSVSLEQAQQQVPFKIRTPAYVPAGLTLLTADVTPATLPTNNDTQKPHSEVYLTYGLTAQASDDNAPRLTLHITTRPEIAPVLLPKSREQAVTVDGQPATYVHGGWRSDGQGDPEESLGDLRWDDNVDSAWLSWQDQAEGPTYTLSAAGLKLTREDMIRIAQSRR